MVVTNSEGSHLMSGVMLPSRNHGWGYCGTCRSHADPEAAWHFASAAVARATDASPEGVRDFLDSQRGRHLADDVCG
jgi:hypothetical protein